MDGYWEDTRKHVSSTLWVIDERNLNVTTITVWVLSPRRLWVITGDLWVMGSNSPYPDLGKPKSYGFLEFMGYQGYGLGGCRLYLTRVCFFSFAC